MKKIITKLTHIRENVINSIILKYRKVKLNGKIVINGIIKIYGHGSISIGNGCRINSKESANPGVGGNPYTVFNVSSGSLQIGNNVGISNVAITCTNSIVIEDNVLVGAGSCIYDTDFHSLDFTVRGKGPQIDVPKSNPIVIKKNAFIGAHSIILKGVTIGEHSIIGAGSVVTKNVPDGEIWGGNPAKKIRTID